MRYLWDEMDVMLPSPSCDYVESSSNVKHVKQQRLFQVLIELNECYAQVKSSILLRSIVFTANQAYAMVVQEESQRKLKLFEVIKKPLAILAGRNSGHNSQIYQTHNF